MSRLNATNNQQKITPKYQTMKKPSTKPHTIWLYAIAALTVGCGTETHTIETNTPCDAFADSFGCIFVECPGSETVSVCSSDGVDGESITGEPGGGCTVTETVDGALISCDDGASVLVPFPEPATPYDLCDPSVNPCENGSFCTWDPANPSWTWDRPYCFACSGDFAGYDCEVLDPCLAADPCTGGDTCSTERVTVFDLPFTSVWGATLCTPVQP
jgi:hypothetical protein